MKTTRKLYTEIERTETEGVKRACLFMLLLGALLFMLVSCVQLKGDGAKWSATVVLTDMDDLGISAVGATVTRINHSIIFKEAAQQLKKAFADYLMYKGLVFLGGQYFTHEGVKVSSAEKIRLDELRSAQSITEMQEKTKQIELMMAAEQPLP